MKRKLIIIIIIFIIIIISLSSIYNIINKNITPLIIQYSEISTKRMASIIINYSINDDILLEDEINNLFLVTRNDKKEIEEVTLNSLIINKIQNRISDICENNLRLIEMEDYFLLKDFNIDKEYFKIPLSVALNSKIFNKSIFTIPVKFKMIGNVTSNIDTDIKEYGINNSLITVSISITVEMKVVLPLTTNNVSVTTNVPIIMKLIQGKIPEYYSTS